MSGYDTSGLELVRVSTTSGRIVVIAEPRDDVAVEGALAENDGAVLSVHTEQGGLEVRVPENMAVLVGSKSGRVELRGRFDTIGASSESGRVSIDEGRSVDVRSTTGRVEVRRAHDVCRARSVSGRITIERTGALHVYTDSGRIEVDEAVGTIRARATSGRIEVGVNGASDIRAETMGGRVVVTLSRGLGADVALHSGGRVDNSAPIGNDCRIVARSVSGRIEVRAR